MTPSLLGWLLTVGSGVAFAAPDPFVGTWVLERSESRYESGALPERMVIVMTPVDGGVHYRSETLYADGRTAVAEYTAEYDGPLVMVTSAAGLLAPVSLKRVAADVVEASYVRGLRVVATARRVTSDDGQRMTITTVSKDADRNERTDVAVFRRLTAE